MKYDIDPIEDPDHIPKVIENPNHLPRDYIGSTGLGILSFAIPKEISPSNSLDEMIAFARTQYVNDIHLMPGEPIIFRTFGQLNKIGQTRLTSKIIESLLINALPKQVLIDLAKTGDKEFVYAAQGLGRNRITMVRQRLGFDVTIRLIPMTIPSFDQSGMPASCAGLTKWSQGLILIAGPAGCGKSTTLSILVEMINQSRHDHIITIESPIEIVYKPAHCQFSQREIRLHTHNQNNALRAALREDPDVIIISELRDFETIQLAISAAETGHLVLGTMNTLSTTQTISRITDSFPSEEQQIIRNMLSESLRGVICQQLIPSAGGKSLVVAYEVLIVNQPVANLIREGKISQINNTMATGKAAGMVLMDNSIKQLLVDGRITLNQAKEHVKNLKVLM